MPGRICQDEQEFRDIVRGLLRKDLLEHLKKGHITFLGPKRGASIPIEAIHIPRIHFVSTPQGAEVNAGEGGGDDTGPDIGIGQGDGEVGDDLGPIESDDGTGEEKSKNAGVGRGKDIIEIEVPIEELHDLFKEVLELPNIKPKGERLIREQDKKYTDIRRVGPESLIHKRRTLKEALKRSIAEGVYNPQKPRIIPERQDKRYRASRDITKPRNNAVLIFMMDVSGSMTRDDRAVVRYFCALCEFWLNCNYDAVETVWIIHDGEADRVTKEEFFSTTRTGGTVASSAHYKMLEVVHAEYPPAQWNLYPIYLSDGFNIGTWEGGDDDELCLDLIENEILPIANQYSYGEVSADRWWLTVAGADVVSGPRRFSPVGNFGSMLHAAFDDNEFVVCVNLQNMDGVPDAIRAVFGSGH